jgi:hypothetical protein
MSDAQKFVTYLQFQKLLFRMLPEWSRDMPESKLIIAIIVQAWTDGNEIPSKRFFENRDGNIERLCDACGLDWETILEIYQNHNHAAKEGYLS